MDRREKNSNQLNGVKDTATNMTVNTQETSQREPEPVQPTQPVQPAQEQNPIPTSSQKSGNTLDKTTRTSLKTALSHMIKEDNAKRYRIKFGGPRKECIDYCNGKLKRKSNEECNDTILLVNEEGEAIKNLQSYLMRKKLYTVITHSRTNILDILKRQTRELVLLEVIKDQLNLKNSQKNKQMQNHNQQNQHKQRSKQVHQNSYKKRNMSLQITNLQNTFLII